MKRLISTLTFVAILLSLCACGAVSNSIPEQTSAPAEEKQESTAEVANPISEETAESILEKMGLDLSHLKDYEGIRYSMINSELKIAQADFELDGDSYCYRVAMPAEYKDISGMYHTWSETSTAEVGYNKADVMLSAEGAGVISWYDIVPGVMYSLSMSENATAEKLESTANKVWYCVQGDAEGEPVEESDEFDALFTAELEDMQQSYHPGTAGCSLSAAKHAAAMADLFTKYSPSADKVAGLTGELAGRLDSAAAEELLTQLQGIKAAFEDMQANGVDILETAGAAAECYPWDGEYAGTLFDAAVAALS